MKGMFKRTDELSCAGAQRLMSPFIDSMAAPEEASRLEAHLEHCDPCGRQLQSFISVRSLLARTEQPAPPEDLVLEAASNSRRPDIPIMLERLEHRISTVLKPLLVPAFFGVSLTALFFGVLFGSLVSHGTVMANDGLIGGPTVASYKPVRTSDQTMREPAVRRCGRQGIGGSAGDRTSHQRRRPGYGLSDH